MEVRRRLRVLGWLLLGVAVVSVAAVVVIGEWLAPSSDKQWVDRAQVWGLAVSEAVSPHDVIRADGRFGLVVGILGGTLGGIVNGILSSDTYGIGGGIVDGISSGVVVGILVGILGGLGIVAAAWVRYHVRVVVAASRGSAPLRFGRFLDWAYRAGLLRVSGVAYQFRHRQLQDWLSSHR